MHGDDRRARREAIGREHVASERAYDSDAKIATFEHPLGARRDRRRL
jgi:hypothetical protein